MNSTVNLKFMAAAIALIFVLAFYIGFQFNTSDEYMLEENELLKFKLKESEKLINEKDSVGAVLLEKYNVYKRAEDSLLQVIQKLNDDEKNSVADDVTAVGNIPISALADSIESRYR